jgi:hypothetical protein
MRGPAPGPCPLPPPGRPCLEELRPPDLRASFFGVPLNPPSERLPAAGLRQSRISATAAIAVLCAVRQMSENSCERVLFAPSSALARTFEIEAGTLDPDGPLLLRPALDPAPVDEVGASLAAMMRSEDGTISPDWLQAGWWKPARAVHLSYQAQEGTDDAVSTASGSKERGAGRLNT